MRNGIPELCCGACPNTRELLQLQGVPTERCVLSADGRGPQDLVFTKPEASGRLGLHFHAAIAHAPL
jgi:hypothetical protein